MKTTEKLLKTQSFQTLLWHQKSKDVNQIIKSVYIIKLPIPFCNEKSKNSQKNSKMLLSLITKQLFSKIYLNDF